MSRVYEALRRCCRELLPARSRGDSVNDFGHIPSIPHDEDGDVPTFVWQQETQAQSAGPYSLLYRLYDARCVVNYGHFLLIVSLLVNIFQAVAIMKTNENTPIDQRDYVYSPAQNTIRYVVKHFTHLPETAFSLQGSDTTDQINRIDQRWRYLYQDGLYLEISESEKFQMLNNTLRAPKAGHYDNYAVGLSVFHELECLDHIRQALYPDHYQSHLRFANGSINDPVWTQIGHCIDYIRQASMCHADSSPYVYMYKPLSHTTKARYDTARVCRRFDALHEWAAGRTLGLYDQTAFFAKGDDVLPLHYGP